MPKDGLQRMLDFLDVLRGKNIHFFITQYSPDGLTVTLTLVGFRVEVEFKVDHLEFSIFKGSEAVASGEQDLYKFIEKYGD
jgi:hypothetical protein